MQRPMIARPAATVHAVRGAQAAGGPPGCA